MPAGGVVPITRGFAEIFAPGPSVAPLFGLRGLGLALVIGVLLTWPMWVTGAQFLYADTNAYVGSGQTAWSMIGGAVSEILPAPPPSEAPDTGGAEGAAAATGADEDGNFRILRSAVYSALLYPVFTFGGAGAVGILQGTLAVFAMFALVDRAALRAPGVLAVGTLGLILLSTLPWHSVYLMPDVLGAIVLIFGAVLAGPFVQMSRGQKVTITLLAMFAGTTHYGNMPLIAGIVVVALLVAALRRRLTVGAIVAAALTVAAAPAVNTLSSLAVTREASAAPLRLPILLARSLQDGPAMTYLVESCPEADYTICEAFGGRVPDSIDAFLWADDGIYSLDEATMRGIREEEYRLLWDVFRAYPVQQSYALTRNSLRQLTLAGTDQMFAVTGYEGPDDETPRLGSARGVAWVDAFDRITPPATLAAALALAGMWATGRVPGHYGPLLWVVLAGLLGNALIFGGLSAPVDRYQSRLVWVVPALLVIAMASRRGQSH